MTAIAARPEQSSHLTARLRAIVHPSTVAAAAHLSRNQTNNNAVAHFWFFLLRRHLHVGWLAAASRPVAVHTRVSATGAHLETSRPSSGAGVMPLNCRNCGDQPAGAREQTLWIGGQGVNVSRLKRVPLVGAETPHRRRCSGGCDFSELSKLLLCRQTCPTLSLGSKC
jgi:hypothetical protein